MTNPYRVSVVIPTYQRCASVQRLLQSLSHQTLPASAFEVIVSIDGSNDGTREMVAQFVAPYALRGNWQTNQGRATACNAGIRIALGDVIVLLDDDMMASPELLAAHLGLHSAGSRWGVVGAVPIRVDATSSPVVTYVGTKFNEHLARLAEPGHQMKLRDFYSGNFSIRREVLAEVGLYSEAFRIYGNEDVELSLRLAKAGVELIYSAEALAYQDYTKDFGGLASDNVAKGRTSVLLATMHPETFPDLKLSAYQQEWRNWRLMRAGLLALSRVWPQTSRGVVAFMRWLEKRRPARLNLYYTLALDYCYWLGVQEVFAENRRLGKEPTSLAYFEQTHLPTPDIARGQGTS